MANIQQSQQPIDQQTNMYANNELSVTAAAAATAAISNAKTWLSSLPTASSWSSFSEPVTNSVTKSDDDDEQ